MSSSDSDYKPLLNSREASVDDYVAPPPPRKRRRRSRSSSAESVPSAKYHLQGHYRDEYRTLFNDTVNRAAARINPDESFQPRRAQLGASTWSSEEKNVYFAALERLGKDDVPGIARAIGTKSIPEVRHFSLLLHDAATNPENTKVALSDIPAAAEISVECTDRLELAGDALAWYQERFEAKKEQERFGNYWIITPEIAEEIENAQTTSRRPSIASSLPPGSGDYEDTTAAKDGVVIPQILQDVPEANLLVPASLLKLSSTIFMNPCPNLPSSYPHWSTVVSPLASKPSIYRTALIDFHTLVVSLTKRLAQASIIQATSRIRTQGWRVKKGVTPLVKRRDVLTAVDMLHVQRNGRERWRRVARRCGLRVFDGAGKRKREMDWNEVEDILGFSQKFPEATTSDEETPAPTSRADEDDFKLRATRSGTPLPPRESHIESDHEDDLDEQYGGEGSDADSSQIEGASPSSMESMNPSGRMDEVDPSILERFDHNANREEELRLWGVLGVTAPSAMANPIKLEGEVERLNSVLVENDWRTWTDYRAEWEELDVPVHPAIFQANQRNLSPVPLASMEQDGTDLSVDTELSSGAEELPVGRRRKRRKVAQAEIPIRGARAYAALQERFSGSEDRNFGPESPIDDAEWPAPSIEDAGAGMSGAASLSASEMDWDAKPAADI